MDREGRLQQGAVVEQRSALMTSVLHANSFFAEGRIGLMDVAGVTAPRHDAHLEAAGGISFTAVADAAALDAVRRHRLALTARRQLATSLRVLLAGSGAPHMFAERIQRDELPHWLVPLLSEPPGVPRM